MATDWLLKSVSQEDRMKVILCLFLSCMCAGSWLLQGPLCPFKKINVSALISRTSKWNIRIIADKVLGDFNPIWLVSLGDTCVKA